jgi:hypothetical protein
MSPGVFSTRNYSAGTKLLLHFDNATSTATPTDSSAIGHIITKNYVDVGNLSHETAQKKYGIASYFWAGVDTAYLSVNDDADWAFGNENFTIDFWFRLPDLPSAGSYFGFCGQWQDAATYWGLYIYESSGSYKIGFTGIAGASSHTWSGAAANQWFHLAVVRGWGGSTTNLGITINGVALGVDILGTNSLAANSGFLLIGQAKVISSTYFYAGYMDEFRITKGAAMWTSTFTPPAGPYR